MLHEFFNNMDIFEKRFAALSSLYFVVRNSSVFTKNLSKYIFVEKCCQEIKLKLIILCKLEIPTILRIIVTYHFEYTATVHNASVWCSG